MDLWNKAPFLRLVLPLLAGVVSGIENNAEPGVMYAILFGVTLLMVLTVFLPLPFRYRQHGDWQGVLIYIFVFTCGWTLADSSEELKYENHFSHYILTEDPSALLSVRVIEPPQPKEKTVKMIVQVEGILQSNSYNEVTGRLMLYLKPDSNRILPGYGDYLIVKGLPQRVESPRNPNQFDYQNHLSNKQVYHQMFVQQNHWQITGKKGGNPLYKFAFRLRGDLLNALERIFYDEQELAVTSALLLGYKERLDRDTLLSYGSSGAMHVLAVSGLHVGIIYLILNFLLKWMDRSKQLRLAKTILMLTALWIYAMITGLSPSVERSAIMFSFIVVGQFIGRSTSVYNTLSASAFLLILLNPYIVTEVGFQLSYLAVLGIVFIQPKIYGLVYFRYKFIDKIWAITCVSIAAQIATFPLGIYYFHQFPNYFLISNLIVIPLATVILSTGVAYLAMWPLGVVFSYLPGILLKWSVRFMNEFVSYVEQLPYSLTYGISTTRTELILMYVIILSLLIFFRYQTKAWLFTGMTFIVALLGYQFFKVQEHNSQKIFTVFHIRSHTAINILEGRNNYLVSSPSLLGKEDQILFNIRHYWFNKRANQEQVLTLGTRKTAGSIILENNILLFDKYKVLVIDSSMNFRIPDTSMYFDYIVMTQNARIMIPAWLDKVRAGVWIIDASNSESKAEYWDKQLKEGGAVVYNIHEKGAYVRNL